jgi:transcriptional regulator with XRE-family HTH domain
MGKNTYNMADVIRRTISKQGWSLYRLGIKTGVDSGRLSRFMTGNRDLTLQAAGRLADALGLRLVDPSKGRPIPRKAPKRG